LFVRKKKKLRIFKGKFGKKLFFVIFSLFSVAVLLFGVFYWVNYNLGKLNVFLPHSLELSGFYGEKTYLVIFQNNNELRPSGGFISAFATFNVKNGQIRDMKFEDVYGSIDDHEYITPPWPMEKLLKNEWYNGWSFRDANYSPNFPSSVEELIKFYHFSRPNENIDAIIAINFRVIEDLFDVVGNIRIDGELFSKNTLFEKITTSVNDIDHHDIQALATRKSILKPLFDELIKKIISKPFDIKKVSDLIAMELDNKEIQIYFFDSELENLALNYKWGGKWPKSVDGDFLSINIANLAGMKSDRYVNRHITYYVKFPLEYFTGDAKPIASVKIDMHHFGSDNIPFSGPYVAFVRIFNDPKQLMSVFSKVQNSLVFKNAHSVYPFEKIVRILPGKGQTVDESFELSRSVMSDFDYSLFIDKQSGTNDFYDVVIEFPDGYLVSSDSFTSHENLAFFKGVLNNDLSFNLHVEPDHLPPLLIIQENKKLNYIKRFKC